MASNPNRWSRVTCVPSFMGLGHLFLEMKLSMSPLASRRYLWRHSVSFFNSFIFWWIWSILMLGDFSLIVRQRWSYFILFVSYQEYLHVTVLNPHILCFSTSLEVNHTMKNCVVCKTGNLISFILNSMFCLYQGNSFVSYIHCLWKFPAPSQVIEDIYPSWCIFWPGKSLPSLLY